MDDNTKSVLESIISTVTLAMLILAIHYKLF